MRLIILAVSASILARATTAPQCTGIAASQHDGQTWVTCTEPATGSAGANYRYLFYRNTSGPITTTAGASLIATNYNNGGQFTNAKNSSYAFTQTTRQSSAAAMAVITAGGVQSGGAPLAYGTQLAVYTATGTQTAYYAIVTHDITGAQTDSAITTGVNSLASGVSESVSVIKPIIQAVSTDSSRYQSSASTKITLTSGARLCMKLHGSGGSAATWGDLWGLWGNSAMAYQDGSQSMWAIYQGAGCTGDGALDLILTPQDMVWRTDAQAGVETYWFGYNFGGFAQSFTGPRLDRILDFATSNYALDANHLVGWGDSMGTLGISEWALRKSPNPFSLLLLASPFPRGFNGWITDVVTGGTIVSGALTLTDGVTQYAGLSAPPPKVPQGGFEDTVAWLTGQGCGAAIPPIVFGSGRTDLSLNYNGTPTIGPAWAAVIDFISLLKTCHFGFAYNWASGGHGTGLTALNVVAKQYINAYSKNVSYPAFTNFSLDSATGDGTYTVTGGVGSVNNGSTTGCLNCGWTWSPQADAASQWKMCVANSTVTSTATVDITARNPQTFNPGAGTTLAYAVTSGACGSTQTAVSSGTIITDTYGLATLTTVPLTTSPVTLTFTTTSPITCLITTTSLPGGLAGVLYSQSIATSNCASPSFSISAGVLPTGLSIGASTGIISGTPTVAGSSSFTVAITDANGTPTQALSVLIAAGQTFQTLHSATTGSVLR